MQSLKSKVSFRETETPEVDTSSSSLEREGRWLPSGSKVSAFLLSTTGLSFLLLVVGVVLALRYQGKLSRYMEFGDESETIVVARMILSGRKLYSEIFNHHGPLTFLPGVLLGSFGNVSIAGHRVLMFVLQWISLGAVYFSPVLRSWTARNFMALAVLTVWTVYLPEMYGHMYVYQNLTGLALVVILASYVLPSLLSPVSLAGWSVALGNSLIACLPFFAVTFIPATGLLFLAGLRKAHRMRSVLWFALASLFNLCFFLMTGSFKGFLAYHLYLNVQILPAYHPITASSAIGLLATAFSTLSLDLLSFGLIALLAAVGAVLAREGSWHRYLCATAVVAAVTSLLVRGGGFQGPPFYYACSVLPLVFFSEARAFLWPQTLGWTALSLAGLVKLSLAFPGDRDRITSHQVPTQTAFGELAQVVTKPDEPIIAYSFQNFEYLAANRLPGSTHFFLLPPQVKYNENPQFGVRSDPCEEIKATRPKVMRLDRWTAWDRFEWASYGGCIQALVDDEYQQILGEPSFYVRKDLTLDDFGVAAAGTQLSVSPSAPLEPARPLALHLSARHHKEVRSLRRVGILFGTYTRSHSGSVELRLVDEKGRVESQRFSLRRLKDNTYRYFDLAPQSYRSAELVSLDGQGISTFEARDSQGQIATCVIYEYSDGQRRFTPGCPFL